MTKILKIKAKSNKYVNPLITEIPHFDYYPKLPHPQSQQQQILLSCRHCLLLTNHISIYTICLCRSQWVMRRESESPHDLLSQWTQQHKTPIQSGPVVVVVVSISLQLNITFRTAGDHADPLGSGRGN